VGNVQLRGKYTLHGGDIVNVVRNVIAVQNSNS